MPDYTNLNPFFGSAIGAPDGIPAWLNAEDGLRLAAYAFYDDLYRNSPEQFKLLLRGADETPIFLPSAKRIIGAYKRYVGRKLGFSVPLDHPRAEDAVLWINNLFERERLRSVFNMAKLSSLKMGDGLIYITADPAKLPGTRLKIVSIDPGTYFPIYADKDPGAEVKDPDKLVGCDLVEQITIGDKTYIKRQRYLKASHSEHPSFGNPAAPVQYEVTTLEFENWDDPAKAKVFQVDLPPVLLPEGITALPVYHFKCHEETGDPFGSPLLYGLERPMLAMNQAITDQDVALSMAGLGMYKADSTPVDEKGNPTNWRIGPKEVVSLPEGGIFERVSGVPTVKPSLEHIEFLSDFVESTLGVSPVALGQVDTAMAESGIALALRMAPLLDATDEIDDNWKDVLANLFWDLKAWLKGYEGVDLADIKITPNFEAKLPKDRDKEAVRVRDMWLDGVVSLAFYRAKMAELYGYTFPADMQATIDAEQAAKMALEDPYGLASGGGLPEPQPSDSGVDADAVEFE